MTLFYAHSGKMPDKSDWQLLEDHLCQVAKRADKFASVFGAGLWGRTAGLLHDSGKATRAFQLRLEGNPNRVDHSTFGAREAVGIAGALGPLLAYVITGHHGGLANGGYQEGELHFRLRHGKVPGDAALLNCAEIQKTLAPPFKVLPKGLAGFRLAFFTRMIFSCLVDSDFLDTEAFCAPERYGVRPVEAETLERENQRLIKLKAKLDAHLDNLCRNAKKTRVNAVRQKILAQCREKAVLSRQIFSLSVPTGGGKTLSSLAFAMDHAAANKMRRIIYAIPFTSILEQNAQVFREVLGPEAVLEHHSNYKEKDDPEDAAYELRRGLATENWDTPVVVTTNVQFFESLFSHKPSRCRKLHNIAGSVIVLDEAQCIPTEYLEPCLAALNELVDQYACTLVLCTATQPAFDDGNILGNAFSNVEEIVCNPGELYRQLCRTQVHFTGRLPTARLADRLAAESQVLCIDSTKPGARAIFERLAQADGVYHLSTNMYPEHRRQVLEIVRSRLQGNLPVRLISTSLVEAGVDLDFPVVYRAMAGLDSIAQAAGRCNREGKLEKDGVPCPGKVFVYEPEDPPRMPWLKRCASRAKETLRTMPDADPIGLEAMRRYFELLFDVQETDKKHILKQFPNLKQLTPEFIFPFKSVSESFRFIEDENVGVVIPKDPEAEQLIKDLRYAQYPRILLRRLQQYTVGVRHADFIALDHAGALEMVDERIPVLRNLEAYSPDVGLCVDKGEVWEAEIMIV